jgi:hypothetical protein
LALPRTRPGVDVNESVRRRTLNELAEEAEWTRRKQFVPATLHLDSNARRRMLNRDPNLYVTRQHS